MKTINSIRQYIPIVFFSLALMATSSEVSAQNQRNNNKSDKNINRKEYRNERSGRQDQPTARSENRNGDRKEYKNDRSYGQNQSLDRNESRNRDGNNYERQNSGRNNGNYESSQNYSNHPKYGRVYQRFDHNPIVFRHSRGNYYYSGNQFYSYRRGVGYYVVEPPRNEYFSNLPFECERVHAHGQVFYQNGDLFFSYSPRGYRIVPSPFEVNFSVRF